MMPGLTMGESASFHNHVLIWSMSFHRDPGGRVWWWKKKANSCFRVRQTEVHIPTPSPAK